MRVEQQSENISFQLLREHSPGQGGRGRRPGGGPEDCSIFQDHEDRQDLQAGQTFHWTPEFRLHLETEL